MIVLINRINIIFGIFEENSETEKTKEDKDNKVKNNNI